MTNDDFSAIGSALDVSAITSTCQLPKKPSKKNNYNPFVELTNSAQQAKVEGDTLTLTFSATDEAQLNAIRYLLAHIILQDARQPDDSVKIFSAPPVKDKFALTHKINLGRIELKLSLKSGVTENIARLHLRTIINNIQKNVIDPIIHAPTVYNGGKVEGREGFFMQYRPHDSRYDKNSMPVFNDLVSHIAAAQGREDSLAWDNTTSPPTLLINVLDHLPLVQSFSNEHSRAQ